MPDYAVSTAFTARDQVTKAFDRMSARAGNFGNRARSSFKSASSGALSFKKIVGGILTAGAVQRGVMALRQGVGEVVTEFIDFDQAVTSAAAKFPERIRRGTKAFDELAEAARKVGAETQFTAAEAARGLNFLAMAGFTSEQAIALLPKTVDLATVAEMDLSRATDIASDALGAFGLMTNDTAQLTKNLSRVNDVFAKTITTANVNMEDLYESMKDAGPVLTATGGSLEDFAAMAGLIGSAGIKGSKAGTTLKNAFLNLAAPTKQMINKMKSLRVEAIDPLTKNLKDPVTILGDLAKATEGMGTAQRAAALNTIFGKRAIAGMATLLDLGGEKIDAYRQKMIDAGGSASEMAEDMRKSLGNRLEALKSSAIEVGFKFIDAFKDKAPGAIDAAIEAVRKFDVKNVIDDIQAFWSWLNDQLIPTLKDLSPIIAGITAGFIAFKVAMTAVAIMEAVAGFMALTKGIMAASASMSVLNALFLANPIGVIVVAVGALVAGIVLLIKHWDWVKQVVSEAADFWVEKIGAMFSVLWDGVKNIGAVFGRLFEKLWNWWSELLDNPFIAAIGTIFMPMVTIPSLIIKNWEPIKEFFGKIFDFLSEKIQGWKEEWNSWMDAIGIDVLKFENKAKKINENLPGRMPKGMPNGLDTGLLPSVFQAEAHKGLGVFSEEAGSPLKPGAIEAPNRAEVESMKKIGLEGKITLAGAPKGTTFESKTTGAPPIKTEVLGAQ